MLLKQTSHNDDKNNTNFMCWIINHHNIKGETIKIQGRNNGNSFSQRF